MTDENPARINPAKHRARLTETQVDALCLLLRIRTEASRKLLKLHFSQGMPVESAALLAGILLRNAIRTVRGAEEAIGLAYIVSGAKKLEEYLTRSLKRAVINSR